MEQMLRNTEKVVQQFPTYPSVTQVPLDELKTNPFRQTSRREGRETRPTGPEEKREATKTAALKNVQNLSCSRS